MSSVIDKRLQFPSKPLSNVVGKGNREGLHPGSNLDTGV